MTHTLKPSRRLLLKSTVVLAGAGCAAVLSCGSQAQQKASKDAMKYQDHPNGQQQCDGCVQFVAPDACKVVDGKISPKGWCIVWAKKP